MIAVAHRLRTLAGFEQVVELGNGKVVDSL